MSCEHDPRASENLRRWQQSGAPRRWVADHQGRWGHDDWLALLESLQRSPFWPLGPAEVGRVLEESKRQWWNLRRWEQSGQARQWVDTRQGQWDHNDWLALLDSLRQSSFWPLDAGAVGEVLESIQAEWRNLRRWEQSEQARRWVETREGRWERADWLALWESLQQSEFWPLPPEAAEAALKRLSAEWWNLRRWRQSGYPEQWVEARGGQWTHDDWLALLDVLRRSQFWPLHPAAVGAVLEEIKRQQENLHRWRQSGRPRQWVEARQGRWDDEDWRALLEELQRSSFWPLGPAAVETVLQEYQAEYRNLQRWQESGRPRRWVEAHEGRWTHDDWLALVAELRASEFWPLKIEAAGEVLRQVNLEWWNLRRWRLSGQARRWVEARQGRWDHHDWLALLAELRASEFWPADRVGISRVLEEARTEWWNLRRWRQSGQPHQWIDARQGQWDSGDLRALLTELERSVYWPLDPAAVERDLQGLRGEWEIFQRWQGCYPPRGQSAA